MNAIVNCYLFLDIVALAVGWLSVCYLNHAFLVMTTSAYTFLSLIQAAYFIAQIADLQTVNGLVLVVFFASAAIALMALALKRRQRRQGCTQ